MIVTRGAEDLPARNILKSSRDMAQEMHTHSLSGQTIFNARHR